jgi:hypothetical protein
MAYKLIIVDSLILNLLGTWIYLNNIMKNNNDFFCIISYENIEL